MASALKWSAADLQADVLRLDVVVTGWRRIQSSVLTLRLLTLASLLLAWTTALSAFMTAAIEGRSTDSRAHWWFVHSLVAG